MLRRRVLSALLWKELLRFRYNWGLLVMVGAVLALSALLSISARLGQLPGQTSRFINRCLIVYDNNHPPARQWADFLAAHLPNSAFASQYRLGSITLATRQSIWNQGQGRYDLSRGSLAIDLMPPANGSKQNAWRYRLIFPQLALAEVLPYRYWFTQTTHQFLGNHQLQLDEDWGSPVNPEHISATEDRVPVLVTGLVIFAFYLMSFNLYITSTGEEREKRVLLALMLTPTTPAEMIGAKVIFYAAASLFVALAVVAMYQPIVLLNPLLWSAILSGSICYISIGTVALCWVRRQTTINTISMIYLIFTALVMFMGTFLVPFFVLRFALIENYTFRHLADLIAQKQTLPWWMDQSAMWLITSMWVILAIRLFNKHGSRISVTSRSG